MAQTAKRRCIEQMLNACGLASLVERRFIVAPLNSGVPGNRQTREKTELTPDNTPKIYPNTIEIVTTNNNPPFYSRRRINRTHSRPSLPGKEARGAHSRTTSNRDPKY